MKITEKDVGRSYLAKNGLSYIVDDVLGEDEVYDPFRTVSIFHISEEKGVLWHYITPLGCLNFTSESGCDFKEWVD